MMKKYWRLLAIVTAVVLGIGTFYIKPALSADSYPEFTFKTIEGDASLLDSVVLSGHYQAAINGTGPGVTLTAEESEYESEQSFFERIKKLRGPEMRELQDEYPAFMRGKTGNLPSYYEDSETLAYANIANQNISGDFGETAFEIAVLDKADEEAVSFTAPVPDRGMYSQVFIQEVQMANGSLKVVTDNLRRDMQMDESGKDRETYIYTFDVEEQELQNAEVVQPAGDEEERTVGVHLINGFTMDKHETILFRQVMEMEPADMEGQNLSVETSSSNLFAYNLATAEQQAITLPNEYQDSEIIDHEGSLLYLFDRFGGEIVLYDWETDQVEQVISIPLPSASDLNPEEIQFTIGIENGKIYAYRSVYGKPLVGTAYLSILDAADGEQLYIGMVIPEEPLQDGAFVNFYDMNIMETE